VRPKPLFHDPYAARLAGEEGEHISKTLPFHEKNAWSWVTRTYLFDSIITKEIEQGTDIIVNLAAGLDARPYRMSLPAQLQWVEVDLPDILDYKESVLAEAKPVCSLERVRMNLSEVSNRRALFESLGRRAKRALIITEGLIVYFTAEEVAALAEDLARPPSFQRWVTDVMSPGLLKMIQAKTHSQFAEGVTLKFAPANGPAFFMGYGWKAVEVHSTLKSAASLKRLPLLYRLFAWLPENPERMGSRPWSGTCLLARTQPVH
jgi:methyltransferase (TIGR00027 family)